MKSLEETKAEFARRLAEWRANSVDLPPLEDQQIIDDGTLLLDIDDDEDRELPPVSFDVNLITFDE